MKVAVFAAIIFIFAAYLRITQLDLIEFKYDESYTVFQMAQFFEQPSLMQVGPPQSTGVYNFPLFNYLMVCLSLFSRNPMYLSFLIGLVNSIFIVVFYLLFRKRFGDTSTFLAGLFLALSPWSVIFSRKIWIPDLIFPFALFSSFYLCKVVLDKDKKAILPLFLSITLMAQMHASGIFFAAITGALLLTLRMKQGFFLSEIKSDYRLAAKGVLIGLIPAIPYFIRQLTSTPFCVDCAAFLNYQNIVRTFDFSNFIRPWDFYSGLSLVISLGASYPDFLKAYPIIKTINWFFYSEYALLLAGIILLLRKHRQYLFLLFYPIVLPLLYFLTKTPGFIHYFVVLIPIMMLLFLLSLQGILHVSLKKWYRFAVYGTVGIFLLSNLIFDLDLRQFIAETQNIKGDYGPIYKITDQYVTSQLQDYFLLPNYDELRAYAFMFAQSPAFHEALGNYFMQKNQAGPAETEFNKALSSDPKNTRARVNLIYIYAVTGNKNKSQQEMDILKTENTTLAGQLQAILNQQK